VRPRREGPYAVSASRFSGRRVLSILALALAGFALTPVAGLATSAAARAKLAFGVPTVVDPIRGAGEPYIAVDAHNNPWITGPGGSTVLSSYFWQSRDGGQTFALNGPPGGHWLCPTGGSDSSVLIDRLNGNVYLADQQSLAQVATAVVPGGTGTPQANCFAEPAWTADRPFFALLHPTGRVLAPQYAANQRRPMVYQSWLCDGCLGGGNTVGGLAFAWSDDGVTWHPADPGVPADTLVTDHVFEASGPSSFQWHGPMAADQKSGYVFTAISCSDTSCPDDAGKNEFGVLVGKPGPGRTDPSNVGQFQSITYQPAATRLADGKPIPEDGSLFPVAAMDKAGTLYVMWVQGDGFADASLPPPASSWHVYYAYSKDQPDHKHWSKPIRVDTGPQTKTSTFGWVAAGDPGKLAFLWLGTTLREHPSKQNPNKQWWPFVSITTDATSAHPHFQQVRVGLNPNHLSDICLRGLTCSVTVPPGNRNMADFNSIDIGPDGSAQATWASDANQISTLPTSLVPGVPVTMTARQIAGPKLVGSGNVTTTKLSTKASTSMKPDVAGDGRYPVGTGANVPQLDLRGARVAWAGGNLQVHIPVQNLASLASPDPIHDVWWIVTWQFAHKIWFAKADSDLGMAPEFTAGAPASYDRPGLAPYTIPQLVDYKGGTEVTGKQVGNEFVITVPAALVGNPKAGSVLESVTGWTMLGDDLPPFATLGPGNVPQIVDAVPAFNALLAR
jgi:hypothetical protein